MERLVQMEAVLGTPLDEIRYAFRCMSVAEEVIARLKATPEQAQEAFGVLKPSPILRTFSMELYERHAEEIVRRVMAGQDVRPGTKAEVLAMMSETSLKAPLNQPGQALTEALFRELFPKSHALRGMGMTSEWHVRQVQEDFEEAKRRLSQDRRCG